MSVKTVGEVAENYFNTLNPIAERISNDIESIKEAYEDLWHCLSNKEKEQIINETVIYPEAVLKYALNLKNDTSACNGKATGAKIVVDEHTGACWRDEHSAPFSWKTPSQINLHLFGTQDDSSPEFHGGALLNNKINLTKNMFQETHNHLDKTIENGTKNHEGCFDSDKIDGWGRKLVAERTLAKKMYENPEPPNVVLGGTCSRISELCSRLKFLPGKTCSYEVKTVVSAYPPTDGNLIDKIRANTVLKIQNTIRLVGGRGFISGDKKAAGAEVGETETLVQAKPAITVAKLQKPSPKVAKPKSPPPPPPVLKPLPLQRAEVDEATKMIVAKANLPEQKERCDEEATLLHDDIDPDPQLEDPARDASTDNIPKSGFDFLDNW